MEDDDFWGDDDPPPQPPNGAAGGTTTTTTIALAQAAAAQAATTPVPGPDDTLAPFPRLRALLECDSGDEIEIQVTAAAALQEQYELAPFDGAAMFATPPRPTLVQYVRAVRWSFVESDPGLTRLMRERGVVITNATVLWLVEAHLNMGGAREWYSVPLKDVTNRQFPSLGFLNKQFPRVSESAEAKAMRTSAPVTAVDGASNWEFDTPVMGYDTFETDMTLEFLTWILTAQLYPAVGGRSVAWLTEFAALFGLVRARAHVLCTQRMPPGVVCEQHRVAASGAPPTEAGGGGGAEPKPRSAMAAAMAKTATRPRGGGRAFANDYDGASDTGDADGSADADDLLFLERGPGAAADGAAAVGEDDSESTSPLFDLACECYCTSIELELLKARAVTVVGTPRPAGLDAARRAMLLEMSELNDVGVMQDFRAFVARAAILPCDRRIYAARIQTRNPSAGMIATTKNHNMVAFAATHVVAAARAHKRLFGDFMLDALLRARVEYAGTLPTDACEVGAGGWCAPVDGGGDGAATGTPGAPRVADLVARTPWPRPALFRCAARDLYCVVPGGGRPCNEVYAFDSIAAAALWLRETGRVPPALHAALDFTKPPAVVHP